MKNNILPGLLALLVFTSCAINIPTCTKGAVSVSFRDSGKGTLDETTKANLCHDSKYLYVDWENIDREIISTFTKCNDPLFK
jgi:hypothetical protein